MTGFETEVIDILSNIRTGMIVAIGFLGLIAGIILSKR